MIVFSQIFLFLHIYTSHYLSRNHVSSGKAAAKKLAIYLLLSISVTLIEYIKDTFNQDSFNYFYCVYLIYELYVKLLLSILRSVAKTCDCLFKNIISVLIYLHLEKLKEK